MLKKTQRDAFLKIAYNFVIHPQILIFLVFLHTDCKYNFSCHCSFIYLLLPSICARTEENIETVMI